MEKEVEILLGKFKHVKSVNVDNVDKIQLINRESELTEYDVYSNVNASETYVTERERNAIYRIYGRIDYVSMLNGLKLDYKYTTDYYEYRIDNSKNIFNSFKFYVVKPSDKEYVSLYSSDLSIKKYIRKFEVIATPNNIDIYPAGFTNNIFGKQVYAFNVNIDIDVREMYDYLGFPLTELYLMPCYIKKSNGFNTSETISGTTWESNGIEKKMTLLNPSEYTTHKRNGDFIFIVNCNRKKMIHNEEGTLIEVSDLTQGGIYTEFKGFITLEITEDDLSTPNLRLENVIGNETRSVTLFRTRIKIPQHTTNYQTVNTSQWRNSHFTFKSNKIYSVSKFNGVVYNKKGTESAVFSNGFEIDDKINRLKKDPFFTVGVIKTTDDFPSNGFTDDNKKIFGANWLNFSIYLPQMGYVRSAEFGGLRINTCFSYDTEISGEVQSINDNSYPIAANDINTKRFIRPNLHWTDFIEVPENHIKSFNSIEKKGFKYIDVVFNIDVNELGYYRNGVNSPSWGGVACPLNGGKLYGIPTNQPDSDFYFYKGLGESDCIKFVADVLNIK